MDIDFNDAIKKAQELKKGFEEKQKDFASKTFSGSSGGGLVTVSVNGKGEILKIHTGDNLFKSEEKSIVEDLIVSAVNNALSKKEDESKKMLSSLNPGLNIPGLDKIF